MTIPILQMLREDHARVLAELDRVDALLRDAAAGREAAAAGDPRPAAIVATRALAARLETQFATHLAAEDGVLYPALARELEHGARLVAPLHAEHAELRAMLAALLVTLGRAPDAARDEQVFVQVRDLVDLLRIHIRKEEALVFSVAERVLEPHDLAALRARRSPDPGPPAPGDHPTTPKGTSR